MIPSVSLSHSPPKRYLMNFLLDATLGMLVIWLAVKLTSKLVEYKQWTLLTFGEYGETQTGPFFNSFYPQVSVSATRGRRSPSHNLENTPSGFTCVSAPRQMLHHHQSSICDVQFLG